MISPGDGKDAAELCLYTSDDEIKVKKTHHWHGMAANIEICCHCGACKGSNFFLEDDCGPYVTKQEVPPLLKGYFPP